VGACNVTHLIDFVVYAAEDKHLRTKAGARVGAARAARAGEGQEGGAREGPEGTVTLQG
jgi:hypothetical protein